MNETTTTPILDVTDKARAMIRDLRADEPDPEGLALWVEVTGETGSTYTYDMWFQPLSEAGPNEVVQRHDDLSVVIPPDSAEKLRGAVLDTSRDLVNPGMVIQNPNTPRPASPAMGHAPAELTGDVAQRAVRVLEEQINPAIAAHGGHAELVAVEDGAAYLRLSGGCAGCGMAAVTLSQGIEVALREAVPEIVRIVDVTDHAAGTNPYYEPAKK
ncbi:MAG: NifU family protein [Acidimicrobiales bacterium]